MVGRLRQAKSARDAKSDLSHEESGKFENVYFHVYSKSDLFHRVKKRQKMHLQRLGIRCTVYATNL